MSPPTATLLLLVLATVLLVVGAADNHTQKKNCQPSCGGVDIPYPFGIGEGCFRPGFEILCETRSGVEFPLLPNTSAPAYLGDGSIGTEKLSNEVRVSSLQVSPRPLVRVMLNVAYQCFDPDGTSTVTDEGNLTMSSDSVYRISSGDNELIILGCSTFIYAHAILRLSEHDKWYYGGCVSYCEDSSSPKDGACDGMGCCRSNIPPNITNIQMSPSMLGHDGFEWSPCDYAFIVEKGNYSFRAADLEDKTKNRAMPLLLEWEVRDAASCNTKQEYACVSGNSRCDNSTNGYVCHCSDGYEGNPYIANGCRDINECQPNNPCPENSKCTNIPAGSYTCKCSKGYTSNGDSKTGTCVQNGSKFPLAAKLTLGIVLGVSCIVIALLLALVFFQKRQLDKSFEKNGGKILQNVKGLTIFTKEGLKKITRNNSDFLGNGSFGKVYKGTLTDDTLVAVKASIVVNEDTRKDFADELEIQTNMIHKNILKLLGCCLEVEVPMLVYEFAANGSLQDILHHNKNQELPLDLRLDIAIGAAEGLKYMHSSTTQAIRHGDVKPDNILLDDKLTPKISDFGLSKLIKEGQFANTVVGCMGYIDPVFLKTGLLTHKSDVYSFGAVLLELITRKKNVYGENQSLIIEFCKLYDKENSGRAMFDEEIANEEDMFVLEEISKLAVDCLCEDIEARPDMTEVAERLVMLRRERKLKAGSPMQQRA